MTSAIGSSTKAAYTPPAAVAPQQVKTGGTNSDGDNDGTKVAAASAPKATSIYRT
jgi:hypothetical protein